MKFKFAACVILSALYSARDIQIYVKRDRKIRRNPIVSYDTYNVILDKYETLKKDVSRFIRDETARAVYLIGKYFAIR